MHLQVLLVLCGRLHDIQQLRKGLANRLQDIKCLTPPDADKQSLVEAEINKLHLQLLAASQVWGAGCTRQVDVEVLELSARACS